MQSWVTLPTSPARASLALTHAARDELDAVAVPMPQSLPQHRPCSSGRAQSRRRACRMHSLHPCLLLQTLATRALTWRRK